MPPAAMVVAAVFVALANVSKDLMNEGYSRGYRREVFGESKEQPNPSSWQPYTRKMWPFRPEGVAASLG